MDSNAPFLLLQFVNFQLALAIVVLTGCKIAQVDFFKEKKEEIGLILSTTVLQFVYATLAVFRAFKIWDSPDSWHLSAVDSFFGTTLAVLLLSTLILRLNGVEIENPLSDNTQRRYYVIASLFGAAACCFFRTFTEPVAVAVIIGHLTTLGDVVFKIVFNVLRMRCGFISPFTFSALGALLALMLF